MIPQLKPIHFPNICIRTITDSEKNVFNQVVLGKTFAEITRQEKLNERTITEKFDKAYGCLRLLDAAGVEGIKQKEFSESRLTTVPKITAIQLNKNYWQKLLEIYPMYVNAPLSQKADHDYFNHEIEEDLTLASENVAAIFEEHENLVSFYKAALNKDSGIIINKKVASASKTNSLLIDITKALRLLEGTRVNIPFNKEVTQFTMSLDLIFKNKDYWLALAQSYPTLAARANELNELHKKSSKLKQEPLKDSIKGVLWSGSIVQVS